MESSNRKLSEHTENCCSICTEQIDYYAIGECGHNEICWRCILKQRIKLLKKECPYCKVVNYKMIITKDKSETPQNSKDCIYDPETDLYFQNQFAKNEIARKIGFFCKLCADTDYRRKFANVN